MSHFDAKYLTTISQQLCREALTYQPDIGRAREVLFVTDGTITDPSKVNTLTRWALVERGKKLYLRLDTESGPYGQLELAHIGEWKGRAFESNGVIKLLSEMPTNWKVLADPDKFAKTYRKDPKAPSFVYSEVLDRTIDWKPYDINLKEELDKRHYEGKTAAVAISACDRPEYFQQAAQSIAHNHGLFDNYTVFVFVDQPLDASKMSKHKDVLTLASKILPRAIRITRPRNFGCGRQLVDIRRQMFDNLGFERAFIFEDDLVVSPQYLRYCESLLEWGQGAYDNIGAVQGFAETTLAPSLHKLAVHRVQPCLYSWLGYLMPKMTWDKIKEFMYTYEDLFLQTEYSKRPFKSIRNWFLQRSKQVAPPESKNSLHYGTTLKYRLKKFLEEVPSGQDGATFMAMYCQGLIRLCPVVSRLRYIGEYGIHSTAARWKSHGFDKLVSAAFEEDETRKTFQVQESGEGFAWLK